MAQREERKRVVLASGSYEPSVHKLIKLSKEDKEKFTQQMRMYAKRFLKNNFDGMKLTIPIVIDGRLTASGGSFHSTYDGTPLKIKISERFMALAIRDDEGIEAILDILKHELVHYAVCMQGGNYRDGSDDFESELARLDIGASGKTNKKKIKTKKENVWYSMLDVYKSNVDGKLNRYRYAKKTAGFAGSRVGFEIVKTYF